MQARKPWAAFFMNFIAGGLGHFYVGHAARFFIAVLVFIFVTSALAFTDCLSSFAGFIAYGLTVCLLIAFVFIDPLLIARKNPSLSQRWYMKWQVYALYTVVVFALFSFFQYYMIKKDLRSELLGYGLFQIPSNLMEPAIQMGDYVLSDTKYYRQHAPAISDIVVVHSVHSGNDYVRRIYAITDDKFSVTADKYSGTNIVNDNSLYNARVSQSDIKGLVTYVAFSKDLKRIGTKVSNWAP
jgi:signal peptidase I